MLFETLPGARSVAPRRIAVIGAGISGLGAAYELSKGNHVTLFEAENRLGGHARTIIAGQRGDQPVDTGFIVYNTVNYPHLTRLFDELSVPVAKSNMSFGASIRGGALEYGLASMDAVFAQRRNLASPRFLRMLRDITRFNARAEGAATDADLPISDFLDQMGTGNWFRDHYLLPLTGAIWSTPRAQMLDFPAQAMIRFMKNHALMGYAGQHQWYTVQGGSVEYVTRLERQLRARGVDIRLGAPIASVQRPAGGVEIRPHRGTVEMFDEVVFATHSDDALRLLADAGAAEMSALGAIRYQPNEAVLHCDASLMPKRRKVWSSWVYCEDVDKTSDRIDLTYWMNSLQPIPQQDPIFVTLNSTRGIRDAAIYDTHIFRHPVFDLAALKAQEQIRVMNGANRTWFCGAWMKNGFHEDGLSSGLDVAAALTARNRADLAA